MLAGGHASAVSPPASGAPADPRNTAETLSRYMDAMRIRDAVSADLSVIEDIYGHYVESSTCTFQVGPGTLEDRRAWFADRGSEHPVLVAEEDDEIVAWAALSRYRRREGYAPTAEDSIYVRHDRRGRGHGKALLAALLARAEGGPLHSILAIIAGDHPASVRLHAAFGFREVGRIAEAGFKMGRWLDVIFMQRMLGVDWVVRGEGDAPARPSGAS